MRRCIYTVNTNFFKEWNSQMAYVLGLIFSDGSVYKTTLSWELRLSDKELLFKIRNTMGANYPVRLSARRNSAELRISNLMILQDLKRLGFSAQISKFPEVPSQFFKHFVRGFFDGDGWIIANEGRQEICVGFSNGNYELLRSLVEKLNEHVSLTKNNLRTRMKITKNHIQSVVYQIEWYATNAFNILRFLYDDLAEDDLYLQRKYKHQLKARQIYLENRKSPIWREVERRYKMPMKELLSKLLIERKLNGVQIAEILGVDSCTVYKWLAKTGIRLPKKKVRKIFIANCPVCGKRFEHILFRKYCSRLCMIKGLHTGKIVIKCVICGRHVYRPGWWFKINKVSLCSRTCMKEWQKIRVCTGLIKRCEESGRFLPSTQFQKVILNACHVH